MLIACQFKDSDTKNKGFNLNNPLPVEFGDPYVVNASEGMYYMIRTEGVTNEFQMYSSTDLMDWKDEGKITTVRSM